MRMIPASMACLAMLTVFAAQASAEKMCGRADNVTIVDLLIELQKPQVTSQGRSTTTVFMHDPTDDTLWGISVANTTAHPAAVCSRSVKKGNEIVQETGVICTASEKVCTSFVEAAVKRMSEIREKLPAAPKP